MLSKAKTGTGKTLAFLIPAIERAKNMSAKDRHGKMSVLIISPTRELAKQISDEAAQMLKFMPDLHQYCIFGGAAKPKSDLDAFRRRIPDILVATPGRLQDHLVNAVYTVDIFLYRPMTLITLYPFRRTTGSPPPWTASSASSSTKRTSSWTWALG
jgi:superfamily II DNA/RNA helicase